MNDEAKVSVSAQSVLDERARRVASLLSRADESPIETTVAVVQVGEERFGLPVVSLERLVRLPPVTPLPGTPEWVLGLTIVRGVVMTAIDLERWLGLGSGARLERAFLAVVKGERGLLGLTVRGVLGFRDIRRDEIAEAFVELGKRRGHPVLLTTRDLVTVLGLDELIDGMRIAPREVRS